MVRVLGLGFRVSKSTGVYTCISYYKDYYSFQGVGVRV